MTAPQIVSIEPDDSGALMWLVDDPEITGIGGTKQISDYKADEIQYARIAAFKSSDADKYTAAATEYMMSAKNTAGSQTQTDFEIVYLKLGEYDASGKWNVSDFTTAYLDRSSEAGKVMDVPTAYASLGALGANYEGYSFAIELGNLQGANYGEWLLTATSDLWDYDNLFNDPEGGSHIASQLAHPTANPWTPDAYAAPEPTSGLMLLFGGLLLALDSNAGWNENQLSGAFTTAAIAETKKTAAVPPRTYSVSAQRNAFGKIWYFTTTGDETAGWKFAYAEDTKGAALTVTLKADGTTSIAGALPNGTDVKGKAVTIKVSASGYANVGGLKAGAILADFAPVLTVNKVKTVLAIKTNLWFDRKNDHAEGAGEAKFAK